MANFKQVSLHRSRGRKKNEWKLELMGRVGIVDLAPI